MKFLTIALLVSLTFISCTKKAEEAPAQAEQATEAAPAEATTEAAPADAAAEAAPAEGDAAAADCNCTKDYQPVCGDNNVTYPNACMAQCAKVASFKEGACQ
jgi:hypothetical protein